MQTLRNGYICTVKNLLLIVLAFTVLLSSMARTVVVADYLLNKEYIAKVLCVNRDKPQMKCNGKCHLNKQLEKQANAETEGKDKPVRAVKEITGVLVNATILVQESGNNYQLSVLDCSSLLRGVQSSVFHPPCTII